MYHLLFGVVRVAVRNGGRAKSVCPLGPLGFEGAQHRQALRPSVDGIRSKALRPFGLQVHEGCASGRGGPP